MHVSSLDEYTSSVSTASSTSTNETTKSGSSYELSLTYVHPIVGGLSYLASFSYSGDSSDDEETSGSSLGGATTTTTTKSTNKSSTFAIAPLGVRVDF